MRLFVCFLLTFLMASTCSVVAAPVSLNIIPIAEVLPTGLFNPQLQLSQAELPKGDSSSNYVQTQYGLGGFAGVGVDASLDSGAVIGNFKLLAFTETARRPALAVGIQNIGLGFKSQPYIVGLKTLGTSRVHFGLIWINGTGRGMWGFDTVLNDRLIAAADYTVGVDSFLSAGFTYNITDHWSVNVAGLGEEGSVPVDGYLAVFIWAGAV